MSSRSPLPPLPKGLTGDLGSPARDLLRGARQALAAPLRLFEPMARMAPGPIRRLIQDVAHPAAARGARVRDVSAAVSLFDAGGGDEAARFARLAYFGLSNVLGRLGRDDLLISETVAGLGFRAALSRLPADAAAARKAAAVAAELMRRHAIGYAPGTGIALGDKDLADGRLAVFATMLWLLVERPEAEPDEAGLLGLCFDVAVSQVDEIAAAGSDPERLAPLLDADARLI